MKVSTRNIKFIKGRLKRLYEEFNIIPNEESVQVGEESVFINYPGDYLEEGISVDDFLTYTSDLDNLIKENESTVRMGGIRQTILNIDNYHYRFLIPDITYEDELLTLKIVENPILIGLFASKNGYYNEDFQVSPCSMYIALELRYKSDKRIDFKLEDELITRYLYYISSTFGVSIDVGSYRYWEDLTGEEKPEACHINKDTLLPYSEAMHYYANAMRIVDLDIQYHHFYKIIEFFSPVVSKIKAYEELNQKLDTLSVVNRDYQYLDSLLELAKNYNNSKKDRELCKTVLLECVDIVQIFDLLPQKVKSGIYNRCLIKDMDLKNCNATNIIKIKKDLGEVIYSTRNRIVHAKSNWEESDTACPEEDMEEMNNFMMALTQQLISWNGKQPKEFQI